MTFLGRLLDGDSIRKITSQVGLRFNAEENFDGVSIARCQWNLSEADAILLVEEKVQGAIIND